ncbi:alpha/beta hydrolase [Rhodopirellula islandica]|uniref:alpha/beta hydrolase n=1 Tax=Rhodopirellula islandica TaxID=595434 RepID=UPI00123777BB|nr:alpha/beta fold hydrolase [Rhodopirellula islandica]
MITPADLLSTFRITPDGATHPRMVPPTKIERFDTRYNRDRRASKPVYHLEIAMHANSFWVGALAWASLFAVATGNASADDQSADQTQLQHSDLSQYRAADGKLKPIQSVADWMFRRQQIIAGAELAMGPLPQTEALPAFDTRITEDVWIGKVRRMTMTMAVDDSDRLPFDLYLPSSVAQFVNVNALTNVISSPKLPAVVALHPTGAAGKRIVAGQGGRPGRQYGIELAQRGYVVIAPDYPSFGEYADYDFKRDNYASGTMKAIANHRRCVDYLAELPIVDSERIGAIGHSLGGHNAIFLGVFDQRVKVMVSSCGWCPFHDYYGGQIEGWASERYMPRLRDEFQLAPDKVPFDFYELVAAMAPRTFVSVSPTHDANFDIRGVRKAIPVAAQIYSLFDAPEELILLTPDCEHDFTKNMRMESYSIIDRVLQHTPIEPEPATN